VNRIRLEGERVTLRPLSMDQFDQEWTNRLEMDPSVQPIMPTRDALRVRFERSGIMEGGALDLAIEVDGQLIGGIQTYVPPDRTLPSGAFEIGIVIDEPSMRGKGYGTEAVRLLVGQGRTRHSGWQFGGFGPPTPTVERPATGLTPRSIIVVLRSDHGRTSRSVA
jgi:RimJ/RimL family protein N-acetyltransferase